MVRFGYLFKGNNTLNNERSYRAEAFVQMPKVDRYLDAIIDSIATHDMTVTRSERDCLVTSPFGTAMIQAESTGLRLSVEASNAGAINRLKHALVGPISFIAAEVAPDITWHGDVTAPSLPDDLRVLIVAAIEELTPRLRRIVFQGTDLTRYDRRDQLHCRLIFQRRGDPDPKWPMLDAAGNVVWPEGPRPTTRVYTIRSIDLTLGLITIDFALHAKDGPATEWARNAVVGDVVGILGPAANGIKIADYYIFAGDETGLPGIARLLEGLEPSAEGVAFIEVESDSDVQAFCHPEGVTVNWLFRDGMPPGTTSLIESAVQSVVWPNKLDRAFFWGGCEHRAFSNIHRYLRNTVGLPRDRQTFYSHWHRTLSEEDIILQGAKAYLPA
jgi:NADPH-dependent ferric siderophore reductase